VSPPDRALPPRGSSIKGEGGYAWLGTTQRHASRDSSIRWNGRYTQRHSSSSSAAASSINQSDWELGLKESLVV